MRKYIDIITEGWFSDSPEEIAQKSDQMKRLLELKKEYTAKFEEAQATADKLERYVEQLEKRIDLLASRYNNSEIYKGGGGDVRGSDGEPIDVLDPEEFSKNNPDF